MNKFRKMALGLLAVVTLFQISSCTKLHDHVFGNDNSSKKCRIESFRQNNVPFWGSRTEKFFYSKRGDLDSIIGDVQTGSLGAHLFYFTYDNNHRLIKYVEDLGELYPYREVHTYAYMNGRIVQDTLRVIPYSGVPESDDIIIKSLEYDSFGRIIKETEKLIASDGTVIATQPPVMFAYDNNGNLVVESATYDNGMNFLGTNKYLMFTQRDYSRNNRLGATGYNSRKLPLGFVDGIRPTYGPSSLLSFGLPIEINYTCD